MSLHTSPRYLAAKSNWASPFEYQERHSGKKVRTALTFALADLYRLEPEDAQALCDVVEKFNTASLVHDDIVDQDSTRRGAPAVWVEFGMETALISGMFGYIDGLQTLARLHNIELMEVGLQSLEALHIGQYLDTQVSNGSVLPTMDDYRFIAQANTGCFFLFILDACQCIKAQDEKLHQELKKLLLELAIYYRYVNDYCDINHVPHFKKKGFAPDLEGGPKSFLMIIAKKMLSKQKITDEHKRRIILEFGKAGVFVKANALMEDSFKTIQQHLDMSRKLLPTGNFTSLESFLQEVRFQQNQYDDCYASLIRQHLDTPMSDAKDHCPR